MTVHAEDINMLVYHYIYFIFLLTHICESVQGYFEWPPQHNSLS